MENNSLALFAPRSAGWCWTGTKTQRRLARDEDEDEDEEGSTNEGQASSLSSGFTDRLES